MNEPRDPRPPLEIRPRLKDGKLHEVELPPPLEIDIDIVELLREERQPDR
jgi:hypothetical protein